MQHQLTISSRMNIKISYQMEWSWVFNRPTLYLATTEREIEEFRQGRRDRKPAVRFADKALWEEHLNQVRVQYDALQRVYKFKFKSGVWLNLQSKRYSTSKKWFQLCVLVAELGHRVSSMIVWQKKSPLLCRHFQCIVSRGAVEWWLWNTYVSNLG